MIVFIKYLEATNQKIDNRKSFVIINAEKIQKLGITMKKKDGKWII